MSFKKGVSSWNKGIRIPAEVRFFRFVEKKENGCWIWVGGKSGRGYGYFWIEQNNQQRAHRYSYELHKGKLAEGMFACHHCDTPLCVNPSHLFAGTPADNTRDYIEKGHSYSGEGNGNSKLTAEDVKHIRKLYSTDKYSQQEIGGMFGVGQVTIGAIIRHKLWPTIH